MIKRLNHAVCTSERAAGADSTGTCWGSRPWRRSATGRSSFGRTGSDNHHDLGLFGIGESAPPPGHGDRVGLYHLAWEVAELTDLAEARRALADAGALTGESDHGTDRRADPDGTELRGVLGRFPREEVQCGFGTRRLDLQGELESARDGREHGRVGSAPRERLEHRSAGRREEDAFYFELSPNARDHLERLQDFMASHVYPAEPVYAEQRRQHAPRAATPHPPGRRGPQAEARSRGLWNLFLPDCESGPG